MNHLEKIELIERYYFQQLSHDELQAFQSILDKDPAFKQEVEEYCNLYEGFDALHQEAFLNQLSTFEANIQQTSNSSILQANYSASTLTQSNKTNSPKVRFIWSKPWLSIAASLTVILTLSLVYLSLKTESLDEVAYLNSNSIMISQTYRKGEVITEEEIEQWNQISDLYNANQYAKALPLLQSFKDKYYGIEYLRTEFKNYPLYLAICHLAIGQTQEAKVQLKDIIALNADDSDIKQEAQYMLALAVLKEKDFEQAIYLLEGIAGRKRHNYKQQAIDLIYDILVTQ